MNTLKSEKFAFYKWIHKWVSSNNILIEGPVDTPQITAVLQAMGYKLETIDYVEVNEQLIGTTKIEVKCNKSGMRAILSKQLETCICPSSEIANESHFWSVSGTGPSCSQDNLNRVEETHSNLIPTLSKEKVMLIRDILTQLFAIISDNDLNQNDEHNALNHSWNRVRSLSNLTRPTLVRQDTWNVDTKTTLPSAISSPLPKLCKSISQMSLNDNKEQMLGEILLMVKENIDKALVLLPNKNDTTFTKGDENQVSDIKFSPKSISPYRLGNKTPIKFQLQQNKEYTPESSAQNIEKRQFVKSSNFGFTKKTDNQIPKKNPLSLNKKLTIPPNSGIPDRRTSLGTFSKNTNVKTNLNLTGYTSLANNSKPRTGIQSFGFKSSPVVLSKMEKVSPFKKQK